MTGAVTRYHAIGESSGSPKATKANKARKTPPPNKTSNHGPSQTIETHMRPNIGLSTYFPFTLWGESSACRKGSILENPARHWLGPSSLSKKVAWRAAEFVRCVKESANLWVFSLDDLPVFFDLKKRMIDRRQQHSRVPPCSFAGPR
jgi:hypothetical protein